MKFRRRGFLRLAAGAAVLQAAPRIARAETYPARPVRIMVGFPAGNASDIVARLVAQRLSERLGQSFIIDNRPGAGGNIATEAVVNAPPDGYTLTLVSPSAAINATLYDHLNFNFLRDVAPVAGVGRAPYVLVLNPSFPAKTLAEFIAYAKANPGKINMASAGNGSLSHMCGELFMTMTGVTMVHVPYRGSFMPDVLAGQVPVVFSPISLALDYIRTGKLRALAVTVATPVATLPGVPPVGDVVPGYDAGGWYGIGAPRSIPTEIVERIGKEIMTALADPKIIAQLNAIGAVPMPMTAAAFGAFIAAETTKWGDVIRAANIKPD